MMNRIHVSIGRRTEWSGGLFNLHSSAEFVPLGCGLNHGISCEDDCDQSI